MKKRDFLIGAGLGIMAAALPPAIQAQDWPVRPIKLLVPFPPGGASDTLLRVVADEVSRILGQQVLVDNKPGASGRLMYQELKHAAPDGYTIGYMSSTVAVVTAGSATPLTFDVQKDFKQIALLSEFSGVLAVNAALPVHSVEDLVAYAKDNPGKLTYGSFGTGSQNHFNGERLIYETGTRMLHVPYRGEAPTVQALASGDIDLAFLATYPKGFVESGKVRVLAATGSSRSVMAPQIPTVTELGFKPLSSRTWNGIGAPAGVPQQILDKLTDAFIQAVRKPEVRERLTGLGFVVYGEGPQAAAQALDEDIRSYSDLIVKAKIELN